MPRNTSYCQNCLGNKEDFSANFCKACQDAVDAARTKAAAEGANPAEARAAALAQRVWTPHTGRTDPRRPVTLNSLNDNAIKERFGN